MPLIQLKHCALEVLSITPDAASPTRSPLIFLHEGLGSVAMWRTREGYWPEQVCQATARPGLVYSRRGYGESDDIPDIRGANRLTADYMHREAWEVLPELLDQLGIKRPVLIGHSDGATIALLYAARFETEACVVMAPHIMVEAISLRAIEQAKVAYETTDLKAKLSRYHKHVDTAFWQWNDVWLSPEFAGFDIREICQDIRCPVLAIQGREDAYGSLAQIEEIRTGGDIGRVILDQCGHTPFKEQTMQTTQCVVEFICSL